MFHQTWIKITLTVALLLAADAVLLGWLLSDWFAAAAQSGKTLALILFANFALLGLSIGWLLRSLVGVPLHHLRMGLAAYRQENDNRYAGLIAVTQQASDLNEIGLQVNALMNQLHGTPYRSSASSMPSEASPGHRSFQQYAD